MLLWYCSLAKPPLLPMRDWIYTRSHFTRWCLTKMYQSLRPSQHGCLAQTTLLILSWSQDTGFVKRQTRIYRAPPSPPLRRMFAMICHLDRGIARASARPFDLLPEPTPSLAL